MSSTMADKKSYKVDFITASRGMERRNYSVVDQTESVLDDLIERREKIAQELQELETKTMELGWKFETQNGYFILRELKNPNYVYAYKE